jgi:putative ABC transport system permease protein
VLALTVPIDGLPQAEPSRRAPYFDAVHEALAAVPGVQQVGAINHLPLAGDTWRFMLRVEGRPDPPPDERPGATWRVVRAGYFEAMRLPVRGRTFTERDRADGLPVVIVNGTLASRHFPGEDPIGRRIQLGSDGTGPWLTIVGVSANARQGEWTGQVPEETYVPYAQHATDFGGAELTFVLRTAGDPAAIAAAASRAVWSIDRGVPIAQLTTMERVVADRLWRSRVTAWLLGGFALVAVVLAAIGVYGITAYAVSRRTREMGIRLALGADAGHVVRLGLGEAAWPVGAGVAAGCVASLWLARLAASLLFGVTPGDPATFVSVVAVLAGMALLAGWLPARRASRIDPLLALRDE